MLMTMNKDSLLRSVAETGYNVGFGAKKHFATFDIVQKAPGWIAFISLAVGVYALIWDPLSSKFIGASIVLLGITGLYVSVYDPERRSYEERGVKLTRLYTKLRDLYRDIQSMPAESDLSSCQATLNAIEEEYYRTVNSKQILFSDWYAHYKFFWQHQIDWIDEQKNFSLLRDKIPLSFTLTVILMLISVAIAATKYWSELLALLNSLESL